jgi:hypothetical protein
MKVLLGKKRLELTDLVADPGFARLTDSVVALGTGLPERGVAFAFRNWTEFVQFAGRTKFGDAVVDMASRRRTLAKRSGGDLSAAIARRVRVAERIETDLRELSARTGLAWGSKELFLRATIKADPLEGEIFDPSMLFTGAGFAGSAVAAVYPGIPDLSWLPGMNNRVTSVQIMGVVGLFNRTWFRGASRILFGAPYFQIANLATIGFNNVTSSVLVD